MRTGILFTAVFCGLLSLGSVMAVGCGGEDNPAETGNACSSDADCRTQGMINGRCLLPSGSCFEFGRCTTHQQCLDYFKDMQVPYCQFDGLCRDDGPCATDADCAAAGWICTPETGQCRYNPPDGDADTDVTDGGDAWEDEEPAAPCPDIAGVYSVVWQCPAPGSARMMTVEQAAGGCGVVVHTPLGALTGTVDNEGMFVVADTAAGVSCDGRIDNGFLALGCGETCETAAGQPAISGELRTDPEAVVMYFDDTTGQVRQQVELRNDGVGGLALWDMYITMDSDAGFVMEEPLPQLPVILGPGDAVTFSLRYGIEGLHSATGQLAVVSSAASPVTLTDLRAHCGGCAGMVVADTALLRFGTVAWEDMLRKTVTVTNTGDTDAFITGVDLPDNGRGAFEPDHSGMGVAFTLEAGASGEIGVFYHPRQEEHPRGYPVHGNMRINIREQDTLRSLPVTLQGSVEIATPPCVHVDPVDDDTGLPSLNFGEVLLGNAATRTISIGNCGDAPMTVAGVTPGESPSIRTPEFVFSPLLPLETPRQLLPGETLDLAVTFSPHRAGQQNLAVTVATDAEISDIPALDSHPATVQVPVTGYGAETAVSLVPWHLDLGRVAPGCCGFEKHVRVFHTGDPDETATIDAITCATDISGGVLHIVPAAPLPVSLAFGESLDVAVRYCAGADAAAGTSGLDIAVSSDVTAGDLHLTAGVDVTQTLNDSFYFHQRTTPRADIMVGVGCGPGMEVYRQQLSEALDVLLDRVDALGASVRIQVFPTGGGGIQDAYPPAMAYGGASGSDRQQITEQFAQQVAFGQDCVGEERPMEVVFDLLSLPQSAGTMQRRNDAGLGVMLVSSVDALDCDPWAAALLESLAAARNPEDAGVFVAAGPCPDGCVDGETVIGAACGYESLVSALGGSSQSLCEDGFAGNLFGDLADRLLVLPTRFVLPYPAQAQGMTVQVEGAPVTAYSFDSAENAVVFDQPPPAGASITVTFGLGCL